MKRNYGLITAITMIAGIVIGSGIFFKADDILNYANGNLFLGIIIFCVAAIAVIFGALTVSQLAIRTDKPGGLISYAEDFVGTGAAVVFGWFEAFLYLPTLCAVVAWASGIYMSQLLGFEDFDVLRNGYFGMIFLVIFYFGNIFSAKLGGFFQNGSMFIKLIPLVLIALLGLIFGKPGVEFSAASGQAFNSSIKDLAWLGAFGPIAFSFDGWIVSTSICHEIKNSKKNLPLALTFAPVGVLVVYLAYFVGISSIVGAENISDGSVYVAATQLFGAFGAKAVLIAVVISILGTVNGVCLGLIRLPYALALRNMMPFSNVFKKENEELGGMPLNSGLLVFLLSMFYINLHCFFATRQSAFFSNLDISNISICVLYLLYIVLYVAVIKLWKRGEIKNVFFGLIAPILAIIGSLIIFSGSVVQPIFFLYAVICLLFIGVAYYYFKKNMKLIVIKSNEEYDYEEEQYNKAQAILEEKADKREIEHFKL